MKIKVLLVEDHTIVRSSLRVLLERQPGIEVIGEAATGEEAIELAGQLLPDIVIMDVVLRGAEISGIQATRKIIDLQKGIRVIALSVMEDLAYVKSMLSAGASGYLFKGCTEEDLMEALHDVMQGKVYFSEEAGRAVHEDYVHLMQTPVKPRAGELTSRELDIVRLIALGENPKEIANRLSISRKTVDAHKRNLMEKLSLRSDAELTRYALREGIIREDE
ncbi:MAG: response regulator transcription factor [Calditrichaceae bacterium]|nr:response regulator transcription factor [Calditrichia bacterium]NUQ41599.1 response regulator transcription factor [Calditrichaceae bacterium]